MRRDPKPLTFDLDLPYFAVQRVSFQNGTITMFNKDWMPAVSTPGVQHFAESRQRLIAGKRNPDQAPSADAGLIRSQT